MACTDHSFVKSPAHSSPSSPLLAVDRSGLAVFQSPSRTGDLPNIFVQMNEFTRLESPGKAGSSSVISNQNRQRSASGTTNALSVSAISNLHTVLSLPSSARQMSVTGKPDPTMEKSVRPVNANCQPVVDDNKNCITAQRNEHASVGAGDMDVCHQEALEIPAKRKKLSELPIADCIERYHQQYCIDRLTEMRALNGRYNEFVTELFFLQNGGNLMDYFSWKKRPNTLLACYLRSESLEECPSSVGSSLLTSSLSLGIEVSDSGVQPSDTSHLALMSDHLTSTPTALKLSHAEECSASLSPALWSSPITTGSFATLMNSSSCSDHVSPMTMSSSHEVGSAQQESIAELARQEAQVLEKIAELRKRGMWSVRRLPKATEPTHSKAHWDYVLEEMQWLANDFAQERKWKKAGARKVARMVAKYFQEQQQRELKAEREDAQKLKRIAGSLAKMVREFWGNIEKVVQYKQQSRLDERRKKALDMHLSFIVDQTEKYSTWLTEGLAAGLASSAAEPSSTANSSQTEPSSPTPSHVDVDDEDFEPQQDSTDDEETIEKDELEHENEDQSEELAALQKESEMPLDELLQTLPPEIFDSAAKPDGSKDADNECKADGGDDDDGDDKEDAKTDSNASSDDDDDGGSYGPCSDESSIDDEETLDEQEQHEQSVDHAAELNALHEEENMPIEELMKRYGGYESRALPARTASRRDRSSSVKSEGSKKDKSNNDEPDDIGTEFLIKSESIENKENESEDQDDELGTEFLIKSAKNEPVEKELKNSTKQQTDGLLRKVLNDTEPGRQITDIAADALSIQPTGYTLETAHVKTSIPFLIKHPLREYQHVGLDWLATMYEHRLNGILADEMGLGKTIQTIALLAYLACEKGIWGPHLIVVPTSVMLNWEMELKKWCPAFKILTYYGSVKERKMKRTGWTKTNAFHICITSYKLVIQDHHAFRRKKWKYFILDEAQNIKNFKSQRWQTLLNFHSLRRLLLTGTPLQNNLMELWSLMHFLMPHVFQSHRDFKEWFSNPLTGMIEGSREYNEGLVRRLHKVLRPFLLRRLKQDVEKQMPKKYEHVVMCRLSKRQRFLYDDFMSQTKTKETLASGHFMSVINILMQLRKVCNHPDLFDPRPTMSPFHMDGIVFVTASLVLKALQSDHLSRVDITSLHPSLCNVGSEMTSYTAERIHSLATPRPLIIEISGYTSQTSVVSPRQSGSLPYISESVSSTLQKNHYYTEHGLEMDVVVDGIDLDCGLQMSCSSSLTNFETVVTTEMGEDGVFEQLAHVDVGDSGWEVGEDDQRFEADGRTSSLRCDALIAKRRREKLDCLERICLVNSRRCDLTVVCGSDVQQAVNCLSATSATRWSCTGYIHCYQAQCGPRGLRHYRELFWQQTEALCSAVFTPEQHLARLKDVLDRFVFAIPPATAPRMTMHLSHPPPSSLNQRQLREFTLQNVLMPRARCLHSVTMSGAVQFPELRLIQYDCGKLQTLDVLLRQLKAGTHRALIFTQMTRMLDVLESFLSFHGHRYLRLDGTTKVEQRQLLMERFNADRRIFCFILSTRSGGIGVNLTGADTVIFYDSDWNPTMDAQAQDRCHRIGQTRDVHIYRLISERTIEENILKKANEKRLLGNVAIEGGNFTTAFFRQQTIKDLFEEPSGLESLAKESVKEEPKSELSSVPSSASLANAGESGLNDDMMEQALCAAEDETDIQAAKVARAELKADLAEFDENIPWDEREMNAKREREEESKVEIELAQLEKELMPVERYAVNYMEQQQGPLDEQEAEEEVTISKEEWELNHLKAMKEEEERRAEIEEDEMLYTSVHESPRSKPKMHKKSSKALGISQYKTHATWDSPTHDDSTVTSVVDEDSIINDDDFSDVSLSYASTITGNQSFSHVTPHNRRKRADASFDADSSTADSCPSIAAAPSSKRSYIKKRRVERTVKEPPAHSVQKRPAPNYDDIISASPRVTMRPLKSFRIPKIAKQADVKTDVSLQETVETHISVAPTVAPTVVPVSVAAAAPAVGVRTVRPLAPPAQSLMMQRQPQADGGVYQMAGIRPRLVRLPANTGPRLASVPRPAADNVTLVQQPSPRPPTPILEKFGASVLVTSASTSQYPGIQYGSRLSQIVSSISATTVMQNTVVSSVAPGGGTVQYIITTSGRPAQAAPQTAVLMNAQNSQVVNAGVASQPTSIVYQLPGTAVGKRFQLHVPAAGLRQVQPPQNLVIASSASMSAVPKQNFVLAAAGGEKQNFVLLPTSNRQSFILAPAASVAQPVVTPRPAASVTNPTVVLPSGYTTTLLALRQSIAQHQSSVAAAQMQPTTRSPIRPGTIRANIALTPTLSQPVANTVPILEKFALQLNTSPTGHSFEVVSGTSPIKPVQQILYPAGSTSSSPHFVRFANAASIKTVGSSVPRFNQLVLGGGAPKPVQTIDMSQLVIRQPLTQVPVVRNQLATNIATGGTSILQVPGISGNQVSTVIILDSRCDEPNAANNN